MFRSDEFFDMIEVIENVFHRGRLITLHKHAHASDTDDAAGVTNFLDRLVSLQTRMIGNQRTTVRMRNQNWLLRNLEYIESGAVTAVRNINSHSDFVHAFDDRNAEV